MGSSKGEVAHTCLGSSEGEVAHTCVGSEVEESCSMDGAKNDTDPEGCDMGHVDHPDCVVADISGTECFKEGCMEGSKKATDEEGCCVEAPPADTNPSQGEASEAQCTPKKRPSKRARSPAATTGQASRAKITEVPQSLRNFHESLAMLSPQSLEGCESPLHLLCQARKVGACSKVMTADQKVMVWVTVEKRHTPSGMVIDTCLKCNTGSSTKQLCSLRWSPNDPVRMAVLQVQGLRHLADATRTLSEEELTLTVARSLCEKVRDWCLAICKADPSEADTSTY